MERGVFDSRTRSQASIMAGEVLVNGAVETRADRKILPEDVITLKEKSCPYVSRGGLKLEAALKHFNIDVKDKICADIGVATGGFSHCMLLLGAQKVYGIDVGKGQLASEVGAYKNFIFRPGTNARFLEPGMFEDRFEFAAVDVSFISLKMILEPLLKCMADAAELVCLIKPQFELTPKQVPGGIVKTEENRRATIESVSGFFTQNLAEKYRARSVEIIESPIKGVHGNIEYLWYIKTGN